MTEHDRHFHCKNIISAKRRSLRLAREGWIGKIEAAECGFILFLVKKVKF